MANIHAFLDDLNPINDRIDGLTSGFQGTVKIADTKTEDGSYTPEEEGTYPNAGGLTYLPTTTDKGYKVTFIKSGSVWFKDRQNVGLSLSQEIEPTDTAGAVTGKAVYDYSRKEAIKSRLIDKDFIDFNFNFNFSASTLGNENLIRVIDALLMVKFTEKPLGKEDDQMFIRVMLFDSEDYSNRIAFRNSVDGEDVVVHLTEDSNGFSYTLIDDKGYKGYVLIDTNKIVGLGNFTPVSTSLGSQLFIKDSPDSKAFRDYVEYKSNSDEINSVQLQVDLIDAQLDEVSSDLDDIKGVKTDWLLNRSDTFTSNEQKVINSIIDFKIENSTPEMEARDIRIRTISNNHPLYKYQFILFDMTAVDEDGEDVLTSSLPLIISRYDNIAPNEQGISEVSKTFTTGLFSGAKMTFKIKFDEMEDGYIYGSNINNKIKINLQKHSFDRSIIERVEDLEDKIENFNPEQTEVKESHIPDTNVVFHGSSTIWGGGLLIEPVTKVAIEHLYSDSVYNDGFTYTGNTISSVKFLKGIASKITGLGSKIKFKSKGTNLHLCQVIERTTDFAEVSVKADGVVIGKFSNKNETLGSYTETFTGDGEETKFQLERPFTYNHIVKVGGVTLNGKINTGGYGGTIGPSDDYLIIRKYNSSGEVVHSIWFKDVPAIGASITCAYDYGEMICFTKSTVGENNAGALESRYGDGLIVHDPANPRDISSGLDFRYVNKDAFLSFAFTTEKEREIEIEIIGGTNPYFCLNFASTELHLINNAGIGGFTIDTILNDEKLNYRESAKAFLPDVYFVAVGGNDDWRMPGRKVRRTITGVTESELKSMPTLELRSATHQGGNLFTVVKNTGLITEVTPYSLKSNELISNTEVLVGDYIRIGSILDDNEFFDVRTIDTFDSVTGEVTWMQPLNADNILGIDNISDLIGQEISVRNMDWYKSRHTTLIGGLKKINPKIKVVLLYTYWTNQFTRQSFGYVEAQADILAENGNNIFVCDAWKENRDFQKGQVTGTNKLSVTADNSDSYQLSWIGHWQGFKVIVNGVDVYGKDCYIQSGNYYAVDQSASGASLDFDTNNTSYKRSEVKNTNMRLVFFKNKPVSGTIEVQRADNLWSGDFAHPSPTVSDATIGKAVKAILNNVI